MSNLNNQNYCLQKELEEFVAADDAVRKNLDRKHKVDHIRSRVDEVIARSQAEVEHSKRVTYHREPHPADLEALERIDRERARSAHYSPAREAQMSRRKAWGPPDEEFLGN